MLAGIVRTKAETAAPVLLPESARQLLRLRPPSVVVAGVAALLEMASAPLTLLFCRRRFKLAIRRPWSRPASTSRHNGRRRLRRRFTRIVVLSEQDRQLVVPADTGLA